MKKIEIELSNGEKIPSVIINEELIYGVTAIAIGTKNKYLKILNSYGKLDNIFVKHPLTNEMLPIIVLDNDILEEFMLKKNSIKFFNKMKKENIECE